MGIFDFFKKKAAPAVEVLSPMEGRVIDLSSVPDPAFAQKIVGNGVAIEPFAPLVVAPISGKVIKLFHTNHAFIIRSETASVEIMVHIGVDTVHLNGQGFTPKIKEGDTVKAGDPIVELDLDYLKANAKSIITPILYLDTDGKGEIVKFTKLDEEIKQGGFLYEVKTAYPEIG